MTKSNDLLPANAKLRKYDKWALNPDSRWEIPSDHPGQNKSNYYRHSKYTRAFYLMHHKSKSIVHHSGSVGFLCGYYIGLEGCETRWNNAKDWWNKCKISSQKQELKWESLWSNNTYTSIRRENILQSCDVNTSLPYIYKRVFVITTIWDFNFAHFFTDSLARLSRHVLFLKKNPDIWIHIKQLEDDPKELLRINSSRVISGTILAEEVYIPRTLHCSNVLSNPYEFPYKNETYESSDAFGFARDWDNNTLTNIHNALLKTFPDHNIKYISSFYYNSTLYCFECDLKLFSYANILIGAHGAGLTNMVFMQPGGVVIEVIGHINDAQMPLCGYAGPLASLFGLHHYLYAYDWHKGQQDSLNETRLATESRQFYDSIHHLEYID
eukprot:gene12161-16284_t